MYCTYQTGATVQNSYKIKCLRACLKMRGAIMRKIRTSNSVSAWFKSENGKLSSRNNKITHTAVAKCTILKCH